MWGGLLGRLRRKRAPPEDGETHVLLCYPWGRTIKVMVCLVSEVSLWTPLGWVRVLTDPGERDRDREIFEAYWEEVNRTR